MGLFIFPKSVVSVWGFVMEAVEIAHLKIPIKKRIGEGGEVEMG